MNRDGDAVTRPSPETTSAALPASAGAEDAAYRVLFERMSRGAFVQAADGTLLDVNDAALGMLGLRREEFLAPGPESPDWDVVRDDGLPLPPEERPAQVALATGRPVRSFMVGLRHARTRERLWLQVDAFPVTRPHEHRPHEVLVTLADLTYRRLAEERHRAVIQASMDAFWVVDAEGRLLEVNRAACELSGYSRDELLAMRVEDVAMHDGPERVRQRIERVRAGAHERFESCHRRKDGRLLDVEVSVELVPGAPDRMFVFVRDITARKRDDHVHVARLRLSEFAATHTMEELLTATLDRAEELTDSCVGFYHFLEADQQTLSLQTWSTRTLLEYCKAEGKGQHYPVSEAGVWVDSVHQRRTVVYNDYARLAHKRGLPPGHAPLLRMMTVPVFRDGRIVAVLGVGNKPVEYDDEDVRAVEMLADLAWDIVTSKRAEESRERIERQMQQAQRLESLGVLAGGIAHDFNNLLTGIIGHAELALIGLPPGAPEAEDLREIMLASRRAAELCAQMLAYSGRGRMRTEALDLGLLIEETTTLVHASISKRARLDLALAAEPLTMVGDPAQLRQVVMNLVINASEAMADADGHIRVSTECVTLSAAEAAAIRGGETLAAGRYARLRVADSGCGMDKATLERIFEPFFTTKFTGRGLGLSAVRGIVLGHGGALQVDSEPGRGTTFTLYFPLQSEVTAAPAPEPARAAGWRGEGTILLVDDEPTIRRMGEKLLRRLGFDVLLAADGLEALATFRAERARIRLVLLDLTMPRMSGEEAFRELRRIDAGVPVVVASGYGEMHLEERFPGETLAGSLQKPYELDALAEVLARALRVSAGSPAPGAPTPAR